MTVAIISEYNPFHMGHEFQIKKIREEFGHDTNIVAVMSGNFTQRGEIAIADKYLRAEWATLAGVDLVLELPFPYSMSSAEIFARSAVHIINSLGVVDAISFGSESGDKEKLLSVAENMQKKSYSDNFKSALKNSELKNLGYPALSEHVYRNTFQKDLSSDFFSPNNILALEYIKAVISENQKIDIHTVKRHGSSYLDPEVNPGEMPSAMAIRSEISKDPYKALNFIPESAKESFKNALRENLFPTIPEKLSAAVISHFRLNSDSLEKSFFDVDGGLYNRILNSSFESDDLNKLISLCETKKFTNARIRRGIWNSFFGVTSSDVKELPSYATILAFDKKGRALLKDIKEMSDFPLITKPSASSELSESALKQKRLSDKADSIFQLAKPTYISGLYGLKAKPFVKD